jgi:glycosyltransferase involved in cell wall biosynthesis
MARTYPRRIRSPVTAQRMADTPSLRRLVIVQTAAPDYRKDVYNSLQDRFRGKTVLLAGERYFDPSISTAPGVQCVERVQNVFLCSRRLLWQSGVIRRAIAAEQAILELNPRILSSWLILIARRFLGRHTVVWGHAWSRHGRRWMSDWVRRLEWALATVVLFYTETEVAEVHEWLPNVNALPAHNALYHRHEIFPLRDPAAAGFVFVGRLVDSKKPRVVIDALAQVVDDLGVDARVTFIGNGPLFETLEEDVRARNLEAAVQFVGAESDVATLRRLYGGALASLSPGYAGLSLVQSLGFGVPMIVADRDPHGPEIEALNPDWNGVLFVADDPSSLAAAMRDVAANRESWLARRTEIAEWSASRYCVESMVGQVLEALRR